MNIKLNLATWKADWKEQRHVIPRDLSPLKHAVHWYVNPNMYEQQFD